MKGNCALIIALCLGAFVLCASAADELQRRQLQADSDCPLQRAMSRLRSVLGLSSGQQQVSSQPPEQRAQQQARQFRAQAQTQGE